MRRRGFTLMELVVYTGLFALVGVLLAQMFAVSTRTQRSTASAYAVTGQTETCMQWIRRDLQETVLGSIRSYPGPGNALPLVSMISSRTVDPKDVGLLQISEYGSARWTKHVFYALKANSGALTGDLVRWEVALAGTELDRLPKVAAKPTVIGANARILLHNVICPNQTVTGLSNRPAGWATDKWGGFRVEFVRRAGGESGLESLTDVNPVLNRTLSKNNTRLVEVQLQIKEASVGPPNLYSLIFRVMPRY